MDSLHARYPFLSAARDAVQAADEDLATIVTTDTAVLDRATDRVLGAIEERHVGPPHRDTRVELLSYPVARVLVSVVDENVLTRRYPVAEARTAHDRFTADLEDATDLRSVDSTGLTVTDLLEEFDLEDDVYDRGDGDYDVDVPAYLLLASGIRGDQWRLVNRHLQNGRVPVDRQELHRLLQEAIESRVADDLPLDVPTDLTDPITDAVHEIQSTLADLDLTTDIDTVVPELFPPCMKHLLEQVREGAHLEHHSRFAITSFLTTIGLTTDEIIEIYSVNPGFGEEMTRYQTDHIRGDSGPTSYTPPSCATMKSYGDCHNPDNLCDHISHPLSYYEAKIDDDGAADFEDWRNRDATEEAESS